MEGSVHLLCLSHDCAHDLIMKMSSCPRQDLTKKTKKRKTAASKHEVYISMFLASHHHSHLTEANARLHEPKRSLLLARHSSLTCIPARPRVEPSTLTLCLHALHSFLIPPMAGYRRAGSPCLCITGWTCSRAGPRHSSCPTTYTCSTSTASYPRALKCRSRTPASGEVCELSTLVYHLVPFFRLHASPILSCARRLLSGGLASSFFMALCGRNRLVPAPQNACSNWEQVAEQMALSSPHSFML